MTVIDNPNEINPDDTLKQSEQPKENETKQAEPESNEVPEENKDANTLEVPEDTKELQIPESEATFEEIKPQQQASETFDEVDVEPQRFEIDEPVPEDSTEKAATVQTEEEKGEFNDVDQLVSLEGSVEHIVVEDAEYLTDDEIRKEEDTIQPKISKTKSFKPEKSASSPIVFQSTDSPEPATSMLSSKSSDVHHPRKQQLVLPKGPIFARSQEATEITLKDRQSMKSSTGTLEAKKSSTSLHVQSHFALFGRAKTPVSSLSSTSIIQSITRIITKSSWGIPRSSSERSLYTFTTSRESEESLIEIINPEYSDSQYKLPTEMDNAMVTSLLQESIRSILIDSPTEVAGYVLKEFLESFLDSSALQLEDLDSVVKRLLALPELWEEKTERSVSRKIKLRLIDKITAESIADVLEETMKMPETQSIAAKDLHIYKKLLRTQYLIKGYERIQTKPNNILTAAVESNDAENGTIEIKSNAAENIFMTDIDVLALCTAIRSGLNVKSLILKQSLISDFGIWHLMHLLKTFNWNLRKLDVTGNKITERGIRFLSRELKTNVRLRELILAENDLQCKGGLYLVQSLLANEKLHALNLANTGMTMKSIIALIIAVERHPTIRKLNLNRPLLFSEQQDAVIHLSRMLKSHKTLVELSLQKFGINDSGISILTKGLFHNDILQSLDLSCNCIGWYGTEDLATFLASNKSLKFLNLNANAVNTKGAIFIANALTDKNKTLQKLIITYNNIGEEGIWSLATALKTNRTLSHLHIWGNSLKQKASKAFKKLIDTGRLQLSNVDFQPYSVNNQVYLAKTTNSI